MVSPKNTYIAICVLIVFFFHGTAGLHIVVVHAKGQRCDKQIKLVAFPCNFIKKQHSRVVPDQSTISLSLTCYCAECIGGSGMYMTMSI